MNKRGKKRSAGKLLDPYATRNRWVCCECGHRNRIDEPGCLNCGKPRWWQLGVMPPAPLRLAPEPSKAAEPADEEEPGTATVSRTEGVALDIGTVAESLGCERAQVVTVLSGLFASDGLIG